MVMVYVQGGTFQMGSNDSEIDAAFEQCEQARGSGQCQRSSFEDEAPQYQVTLESFWIDRTEVSNTKYELCVAAGAGCNESSYVDDTRFNGDDYPVVGITWYDAMAYCQWTGGQLPSEAQWEYAARGQTSNIYPWGNTFDGALMNFCDANCSFDWKDSEQDDRYKLTAPVGIFPDGASWVGALDMAGNVWEWVNDWYDRDYYAISPVENPTGPEAGDYKVLRGGSWDNLEPHVRAATRTSITPDDPNNYLGFRCVGVPGG
jgi:serine/threonine-protein kinase